MSETLVATAPDLSQDLSQPDFWRRHFPDLTLVGDSKRKTPPKPPKRAGVRDETLLMAQLGEEGYFQDHNSTLTRLAPRLAAAVRTCVQLDIPPAFIFMFEEVWEGFQSIHPMLVNALGEDYRMLPDFWVWHVNPSAGEAGWRPHRDKGRFCLAPDGTPNSLSVWVPFVDATPLNSCIYVLPINRDPTYNTPEEHSWKINIASVRALPGGPGDYFAWNQALLHWGSETSRYAPHPRISMALEFQRGGIEPFNSPQMTPFQPLDFRFVLKLVGKQILQYKHMYPLAARFESLAQQLLGG